jgi:hypothetical protein
MQKKDVTGDALLAHDADYVRGTSAAVYYAYPSKALPRFLVPETDAVGLRFALRLLTSEWRRAGYVLRIALRVPGVAFLMRTLLFERVTVYP